MLVPGQIGKKAESSPSAVCGFLCLTCRYQFLDTGPLIAIEAGSDDEETSLSVLGMTVRPMQR